MNEHYKQICWLASYPKSGNTWLRLFLDAYLMGQVDINDVLASVPDDLAARHVIGDGTDVRGLPIDIQELTRPMALLRLVLAFNANKFADVPLFVKTHHPNMVANGIETLPYCLTKATVYIVRDPRDVAPSFAKHTGVSIDRAIEQMGNKYNVLQDQDKGTRRVADLLSSWDKHVESYQADDQHNTLVVRYEDMRSAPEQAFGAMVRHFGLPEDSERLQRALELTELDRLRSEEREKGFRESSPHAENQFFGEGRGRHKLTRAQRRKIEKRFARPMKEMGYT